MRSAGNEKSKALLPWFLSLFGTSMRSANHAGRGRPACGAPCACVRIKEQTAKDRGIPRHRKPQADRETTMELKFSKVTRKGPSTIVTLSRPEVYNALHIDAHFELDKVFDDFSADPGQWVAIVTGSGDKAFCAGNDLKWQGGGGT